MSLRVAKKPINLPEGVKADLKNHTLTIKGAKNSLDLKLSKLINVKLTDKDISVLTRNSNVLDIDSLAKNEKMLVGTTCSHINNMITGVTKGFEKKLVLVGVGYRVQQKGKSINLSLGFSHPVEYMPPEGITIQLPSQTEISITGADKEKVGQVAADIRKYRPPEVYKGKGILYAGEVIIKKETKKK